MPRYFATCPKGLELLLRDELSALGASDAREALAGVYFEGDAALGYRACLWSRLASRILMPLAEFDAPDDAALYAGVGQLDWSQHLDADATLAVDANAHASQLSHARFIAQRVKDAVVDQFRERQGKRPSVAVEQPSIRLNLNLKRDRATLSLDLSGDSLHRRGWRKGQGEAPLKENLACAILLRAGWPETFRNGGALVDPMCGAGSLLIEGALLAADVAPGLGRDYFGFFGWQGYDATLWQAEKAAAEARANSGLRALPALFFGYDESADMIGVAKRNAQAAGVSGFLQLERHDVAHLKRPPGAATGGLVVCNPPYGERMGAAEALVPLYQQLGAGLKAEFIGWRASVITSDEELGHALGLRADKRYKLYNGALECALLNFEIRDPQNAVPRQLKPLSAGAEMLKNRLQKNLRNLKRWLSREAVTCFRAYDADLPEYAAAIDVYAGQLHIQEYQAPDTVPEHTARERLTEIVRVAGEVFACPRENIAVKTRSRQRGIRQYGRQAQRGEFMEVEEGGLKFLVNLHDYIDTGLFLDHRPLRLRIQQLARGKRFLNLFCYTASASVHAAAGAALSTTSVDLSPTYLQWAARNLALNRFEGAAHRLAQADSIEWLRSESSTYDLIFVDPPTFSNSKRAEDFDIQREHVELLQLCADRLAPDGLILFSNNYRRFKLDAEALADLDAKEISASTIGPDFARNPRIHRCWEIRRKV